MQYEPCDGLCYSPENVLQTVEMGLNLAETRDLMAGVTAIHELSCGNSAISYGLDLDESTGTFIASFIHYGQLDLVVASSAYVALTGLIDKALSWDASNPPELRDRPGLGKSVCAHGDDHDLRAFALKFSGLPYELQSQL